MNEFVEQFLIEARELVEEGTTALLKLEVEAQDTEALDRAFRAFHTLKGAAGIIEFPAMARALHAAEDGLAAARGGTAPVDVKLVGDGLATLDQVLVWLEAIETSGEAPSEAQAGPDADAIEVRFRQAASLAPADEPSWLDHLQALSSRNDAARIAFAFWPDRDGFLAGQDALARLETLDALHILHIEPVGVWPPLGSFDPFACQSRLLGLTDASEAEVRHALHGVSGRLEVRSLGAKHASAELVRDIVEAQIAMLTARSDGPMAGRVASAARVALNVLAAVPLATPELTTAIAQAGEAHDTAGLVAGLRAVLEDRSAANAATTAEPRARTLRVDVERVDALVRLTGEFMIQQHALGHMAIEAQRSDRGLATRLATQHQSLHRLVAELQHTVLALRVLPMRHILQRFPRLVRELGAELGKPVRLQVEGDATEADKMVVEGLFEPLLHLVRNALDHGLETGAARTAAGKPATGLVAIRASRAGDRLVIEVEDDGAGLDLDRVRQVAATRGVASADQLAALSDAEVIDLVFAPGFSTARTVTGISGRGVGMDAVRSAVAALGGDVTLSSLPGRGTLGRIVLPVSLVMTEIMVVEVGGQAFGLPLEDVLETLRVPRGALFPIGAAHAFDLRGQVAPLIDLAGLLETKPGVRPDGDRLVVVVSAGGQLVGLEVDRLEGRMDVMLKPMDGLLSGLSAISGTTLLGDGRVLLVLDLQEWGI